MSKFKIGDSPLLRVKYGFVTLVGGTTYDNEVLGIHKDNLNGVIWIDESPKVEIKEVIIEKPLVKEPVVEEPIIETKPVVDKQALINELTQQRNKLYATDFKKWVKEKYGIIATTEKSAYEQALALINNM